MVDSHRFHVANTKYGKEITVSRTIFLRHAFKIKVFIKGI